jgi:hypothetical protein
VPDECRGRRAGWCGCPPGDGEARAQLRLCDLDFAQAAWPAAQVLGGGQDGDAESTIGESGENRGIAGLEGDSRPSTHRDEARVECGADAGPGGKRHEGEVGEVFELDAAPASEAVVLADDSDERLVGDDLDGESWRVGVSESD